MLLIALSLVLFLPQLIRDLIQHLLLLIQKVIGGSIFCGRVENLDLVCCFILFLAFSMVQTLLREEKFQKRGYKEVIRAFRWKGFIGMADCLFWVPTLVDG